MTGPFAEIALLLLIAALVAALFLRLRLPVLIAAMGATANDKRAAAHVLFNLLTGCVALLARPWLLSLSLWIGGWVGAPAGVATVLALFHTVFNLLGVLLMWPLSDRLAAFLQSRS